MKILAPIRHYIIFSVIALSVALRYVFKLKPREYRLFIKRAAILLTVVRHNRIVKIKNGYKLQLYLPAWPSKAFFDMLENKLLRKPPAPTSLVFSMTRACGYKCPHCYQKLEKGRDIPEDILLETLKATLAAGVRYYNIEGGEPFLRFERLLSMLKTVNGKAEVWVNTTGNGVTKAMLKEAAAHGLTGLMVSIHATDPKLHDDFTGVPGSFATAGNAIKQAKELKLAVAINSVLSENELKHNGLDKLMELARGLKADFVQLIHPKPCGGWLNTHEPMQMNAELLQWLEKQHLRYNSRHTAGYPSLAAQVFEERATGFGCTAGGVDRFYISSAGEVQPCEFLQLSFGNVTSEGFSEIFARMRQTFAKPGTQWLCCTQSRAIAAYMQKNNLTATPLLWPHTQKLTAQWPTGGLTPLYQKLGIYNEDHC